MTELTKILKSLILTEKEVPGKATPELEIGGLLDCKGAELYKFAHFVRSYHSLFPGGFVGGEVSAKGKNLWITNY